MGNQTWPEILSFVLLHLLFLCLFLSPLFHFKSSPSIEPREWCEKEEEGDNRRRCRGWHGSICEWALMCVSAAAAVVGLAATGYIKCGWALLTQKAIGLWLVFSRWFQFRNKWFQRGDVSVVLDLSTLKPLGDLFPEWVKQPAWRKYCCHPC